MVRLPVLPLGFNLDIEFMQLAIIALVIPWLLLLSQTSSYRAVRLSGAVLAGVAAGAWAVERVTGQGNGLAKGVEQLANYAPYLLVVLTLLAVVS